MQKTARHMMHRLLGEMRLRRAPTLFDPKCWHLFEDAVMLVVHDGETDNQRSEVPLCCAAKLQPDLLDLSHGKSASANRSIGGMV